MKNNIIKKAMAIIAVLTISLTVSSGVYAASKISSKTGETQTTTVSKNSGDSDSDSDDDSSSDDSSSDSTESKTKSTSSTAKTRNTTTAKDPSSTSKATTEATAEATIVPASSTETGASSVSSLDSKYTTKGGAFGWFLLGLILNAIISFAICLRFYKNSKKNNHISAEIRALRRDISTKFSQNVDGFTEYETHVKNTNPSYAKTNSNIKSTEQSDDDETMAALYEKWGSEIPSDDVDAKPLDPAAPSPEIEDVVATPDTESPHEETREEAIERFAANLNITEKHTGPRRHHKDKSSGVLDKLKNAVDSIIPKE